MIRMLLLGMVIALSTGIARANDVDRVDVYEFGTYTAVGSTYPRDSSPQGIKIEDHDGYVHLDSTRTVVARIGARFGFRYSLKGTGEDYTSLKIVWKFPPPGIVGSDSKHPIQREVIEFEAAPNSSYVQTIALETPSDLVPGVWSFEIWCGNKKLAEEKFTVIMPLIS